jgi:hypothetical protein
MTTEIRFDPMSNRFNPNPMNKHSDAGWNRQGLALLSFFSSASE